MLDLTPGVTFILKLCRSVFTPPLVVHCSLKLGSSGRSFPTPWWVHVLFCAASLPVWLAIRSTLNYIREEREIAALGAVRVPELRLKSWPGNLDLIFARLQAGQDGYPGKNIIFV